MFCAPARPIPPQRTTPTHRRRESITNVRATIVFSVFLSISFELLPPKTWMKKKCMNWRVTAYRGPGTETLVIESTHSNSTACHAWRGQQPRI